MSAVTPRSPAPAKKLSEVDFRSGATLEQLSAQVSELVLLEQGEFGDQTALEVHTAKDFIFNMLGKAMLHTPNSVALLACLESWHKQSIYFLTTLLGISIHLLINANGGRKVI